MASSSKIWLMSRNFQTSCNYAKFRAKHLVMQNILNCANLHGKLNLLNVPFNSNLTFCPIVRGLILRLINGEQLDSSFTNIGYGSILSIFIKLLFHSNFFWVLVRFKLMSSGCTSWNRMNSLTPLLLFKNYLIL